MFSRIDAPQFSWPQIDLRWQNSHPDWNFYAQIAGVGAFVIAIFALWWSLREGKRHHQRKVRDDLRETYHHIEKKLKDAGHTLEVWKSTDAATAIPAPPDLQDDLDELRRISFGRIKAPTGRRIRFYRWTIREHLDNWRQMHSEGKTYQKFERESDSLIATNNYYMLYVVRKEIRKLNKLDNGSAWTYMSLRFRRY